MKSIIQHAEIIHDLNAQFTPHAGQVPIGHAAFYHKNVDMIFVECGRKFGKTDLIIYLLYRWMLTMESGGGHYYFAKTYKQAKEIAWASGRFQNFGDKKFKKKYGIELNNSEMRIRCGFNDAFIKLDGSDMTETYRGINPHSAVYEEFKDHKADFHRAFDPNRATFNAPLAIIGTPPETEGNNFTDLAENCKVESDSFYFNYPTWANPYISRDWLKRKKRSLFRQGKEDEWYREYCALRVKSGKKHILGAFNQFEHVVKHDEIMGKMRSQWSDLQFFGTADPASSSVFGFLCSAFNPYTKEIFHFDEIYEKIPSRMSTVKMMIGNEKSIISLYKRYHPVIEDWFFSYDEAAKWFVNEVFEHFPDFNFIPTRKESNRKKDGLGLINDQINQGKWLVSDKCVNLINEINNYIRKDDGSIPKVNDHLIDCMRYTNAACNYTLIDEVKANNSEKRYSIRDDINELKNQDDYIEEFDSRFDIM